jgi:phage terminase large subunit-like protein
MGANTRDPKDGKLWKKLEAELIGRKCFAGIDLASTVDIAAVIYAFPPLKPGDRWTFICRFFCNEQKIAERDSHDTPYRRWVAEGALIATPGNVTDYDFIEAAIRKDAEKFALRHADPNRDNDFDIAIDRFDATQVTTHLQNDGFKVCRFGQGFASMSAPSKDLERIFLGAQIEHGNHPVLHWMFGNAAYRSDPAGNIKPDKAKASDKIDGVVGCIEALAIANMAPASIDLGAWLKNPMIVRGA